MKKNIHFLGVGGVSMCGLAALAAANGNFVSGSDRTANSETARLVASGIPVTIGAAELTAERADLLVYTAAVSEEDPTLAAARAAGVPTMTRAAFLGQEMWAYATRIGVAGVHGKSTVTGMLDAVFTAAHKPYTVLCGASLCGGAPYRIGGRETLLFEACEYKDSFLSFFPTLAVLLNLEWEHVDYFHTEAQMATSFAAYAASAAQVVANAEDAKLIAALAGIPAVTYGFDRGDYTLQGDTILCRGEPLCTLRLSVPGRHNRQNALAAAATAHTFGIAPAAIEIGLSAFGGVARRMCLRGTIGGARVYDDYAHHPTEVAASVAAASEGCAGRLICVFQAHTYSRAAAFADDFCAALSPAANVFFAPIYAAREENTSGITAAHLAAKLSNAEACETFSALAARLIATVRAGDTVLVMGAGDIDRLFEYLPFGR